MERRSGKGSRDGKEGWPVGVRSAPIAKLRREPRGANRSLILDAKKSPGQAGHQMLVLGSLDLLEVKRDVPALQAGFCDQSRPSLLGDGYVHSRS